MLLWGLPLLVLNPVTDMLNMLEAWIVTTIPLYLGHSPSTLESVAVDFPSPWMNTAIAP